MIEVEPGGFSQNDIAKKIYKVLVDGGGAGAGEVDCFG